MMLGRRAALAVMAIALLIPLTAPGALATEDDDPFGGTDRPEIVWDLDHVIPVNFPPGVGSDREDIKHPPPVCAIWETVFPPEPQEPYNVCAAVYVCYGERIDDIYTGEIAGPHNATGYMDYVNIWDQALALLQSVLLFGPDDLFTPETISDMLIEMNLGERADALAIPVFYYCRIGEGGPLELSGPFEPDFGWDTTIAAEYDIPGIRATVVDGLIERLGFDPPEMRAIPPLENGFTYVQFPMWFWLEDPVEYDHLAAVSTGGTIRLGARAALKHVEWQFDEDEEPLTCTVDDMESFDPIADDADNPPPCHHVFRQLESFELTATSVYEIEEQISYRLARADPWSSGPWVPHPTQPEISIPNSAGVIDVHELVSLNVTDFDN